MKRLYQLSRISLWSVLGIFAGTSLYTCYDYWAHPELYAMQSAPWYLSIQINAILSILASAVLLLIMWFLRGKCK